MTLPLYSPLHVPTLPCEQVHAKPALQVIFFKQRASVIKIIAHKFRAAICRSSITILTDSSDIRTARHLLHQCARNRAMLLRSSPSPPSCFCVPHLQAPLLVPLLVTLLALLHMLLFLVLHLLLRALLFRSCYSHAADCAASAALVPMFAPPSTAVSSTVTMLYPPPHLHRPLCALPPLLLLLPS